MKLAILSLALLLVGCAGKPEPRAEEFGPPVTESGFEWSCPSDHHPEIHKIPGGASVFCQWNVVTPDQWEAAQGLYNPKRFENEVDDPQYGFHRSIR